MHFPKLLLPSIILTTTAVGIRLHRGNDCSGDALLCANINPDSCCGSFDNQDFASVGFYGIPSDWRLVCQGMEPGNCGALAIDGHTSSGGNFVCPSSGGYSSARYDFNVARRDNEATGGGGCEPQRPDALVLEDGGRYNVTDLDDDDLVQQVCNSSESWTIVESSILTSFMCCVVSTKAH